VHERVQMAVLGGNIGAVSNPGHGSIFWLCFPAEEAHPGHHSRLDCSPSLDANLSTHAERPMMPDRALAAAHRCSAPAQVVDDHAASMRGSNDTSLRSSGDLYRCADARAEANTSQVLTKGSHLSVNAAPMGSVGLLAEPFDGEVQPSRSNCSADHLRRRSAGRALSCDSFSGKGDKPAPCGVGTGKNGSRRLGRPAVCISDSTLYQQTRTGAGAGAGAGGADGHVRSGTHPALSIDRVRAQAPQGQVSGGAEPAPSQMAPGGVLGGMHWPMYFPGYLPVGGPVPPQGHAPNRVHAGQGQPPAPWYLLSWPIPCNPTVTLVGPSQGAALADGGQLPDAASLPPPGPPADYVIPESVACFSQGVLPASAQTAGSMEAVHASNSWPSSLVHPPSAPTSHINKHPSFVSGTSSFLHPVLNPSTAAPSPSASHLPTPDTLSWMMHPDAPQPRASPSLLHPSPCPTVDTPVCSLNCPTSACASDSRSDCGSSRSVSQRSLCDDDAGADRLLLGIQGVRVLLAEDNLINQMVAKKTLASLGASATVVSNGAEAVAAVMRAAGDAEASPAACPFDVVLMDMAMPIMDGVSATSEIRRQGCNVPIVAMTANISDRDQDLCRTAGMDGFLSKPILKARLGRAIKQVLTRGCLFSDNAASARRHEAWRQLAPS
jgi:CheY-like chemotaxis protein